MRNLKSMLGATLALAGCAQLPPPVPPPQPTEAASGIPAASYELRGPGVAARVVVWSEGAYPDGATYIHFATDVNNLTDTPLAVDLHALLVEPFDAAGRPLPAPGLAFEEHAGANVRHVAAQATQRFDFFFALPRDVDAAVIAKLRVRWGLVGSDGERLVRSTEFVADTARSAGLTRAFTPLAEPSATLLVMPGRPFPHHR